jgi:hypothetical protein
MSTNDNVIAWLVPTACGTNADKTTHMAENMFRVTDIASTPLLSSRLPSLLTARPQKAVQLSFDRSPKRPGSFVLGTDPRICDIILPRLEGISPQHCALGFDSEARLTLEDFSDSGTQVWYDWESVGDMRDHTWILASAPGTSQHITIDIQGVRFRLVLGDFHERDRAAYVSKVDAFCQQPPWADGLAAGWDRFSLAPIAPLFAAAPLFQHIFVKGLAEEEPRGEIYLWNLSKPWEPMVKASA